MTITSQKQNKWFFLLLFLVIVCFSSVYGQVTIAPNMLFIHDNTNIGELYVSNKSDKPQEISINFTFGYPASKSDGNISMNYEDDEAREAYGLDEYIRAFPRFFVLQEGQSQAVRFQIIQFPNRPDGMYWTRAVIKSHELTPEIDVEEISEGVGARIDFVFEQNIALFYHKGRTNTGLTINEVHTSVKEDNLIIIPQVSRKGNSPFLGRLNAKLYDDEGDLMKENSTNVFFYFDEWRRIELPVAGLPSGTYRVDLHFETRRRDISTRDIVQSPDISHSFKIEL